MEKDFSKRISYFENNKRLMILSIEAEIGEENTNILLDAYFNDNMPILERKKIIEKMIKLGTFYPSKYKYVTPFVNEVVERESTVLNLLKKINKCNQDIQKLKKGQWVELQSDYEPSEKEIKEYIKDQRINGFHTNKKEEKDF